MNKFSNEKSGQSCRTASCSTCRPNRVRAAPAIMSAPLMGLVQHSAKEGGHHVASSVFGSARLLHSPAGLSLVSYLQGTGGNEYIGWLASKGIQPKLMVGPAHDSYEDEADRIADTVMRKPIPSIQRCYDCGNEEDDLIQTKRLASSITPLAGIQRKSANPFGGILESLQAAMQPADSGAAFEAGGDIESRLTANRGGGNPLPENLRDEMGERFGADFSGVRVHTGSEANQTCGALNAEAFTNGSDIYLPDGKYQPETSEGQRLLAHELTHVIQQNGGSS